MSEVLSMKVKKNLADLIEEVAEEEETGKSSAARKLLSLGAEQWRTEKAIKSVIEKKASVWKAAENAGMPLREFLDVLNEREIPWVKIQPEELEEEIQRMRAK